MTFAYVLIFGTVMLFAVSVVWVFVWAIRNRQFEDFQRGATSIFEPDDRPGKLTDSFPDDDKTRFVD